MLKGGALRITIYIAVGMFLFYAVGSDFVWDYVPASVAENMALIFYGMLLLLMASPVIIVLVDAVFSKERPTFLSRLLKKSKWYEILGGIVFADMYLFFVLGAFFDGGAYPWGDIAGDRYYVDNNMGIREVSESWFWISYWQGLSAWAGAGFYGVGAFARKIYLDAKRDDQREAVRIAS